MPKIIEIEDTPNPNAKKFLLREPLTWGIARSYSSAAQAEGDALATALFAIEHVVSVFYVDHWITVTQDGGAEWGELLRKVAEPIRAAETADAQSAQLAIDAALTIQEMTPDERARFDTISVLINERVRPYLQGDGGDLKLLGLNGNKLTLHYQGACGGCPSALSGTLVGIESLVKSIYPDVAVIAV